MQLPGISKHRRGNLPGLIIIGAMKCATTSLHYYLNLHPEISMSKEKELDFFSIKRNWDKGIEWYKSHFVGQAKVHGESSPNYTVYPRLKGVPERMYSVIPDAKLIYILRDPIDRIISQYVHNYSEGRDNRSLEDALRHLGDTNTYIVRSKYFMQLQQYLNYFPASNIWIMTTDDLHAQRQKTLQKVFRFLNVEETFFSRQFHTVRHKSEAKGRWNRIGLFLKLLSEKHMTGVFSTDTRIKIGRVLRLPFSTRIERPVLDETLRGALIDFLREDMNRLREHTGRDFESWCV